MFELVPFPQHAVGNETFQLMGVIWKPPLIIRVGEKKQVSILTASKWISKIHSHQIPEIQGQFREKDSQKQSMIWGNITKKNTKTYFTQMYHMIFELHLSNSFGFTNIHVSSVYSFVRSQPPPSSPNSASERHSVALGTKTKGRKPWELTYPEILGNTVDGWNPANHQGFDDCPIIYRVEQASQVLVQDFVHQQ